MTEEMKFTDEQIDKALDSWEEHSEYYPAEGMRAALEAAVGPVEYEYGLDDLGYSDAVNKVPWDLEATQEYAQKFEPSRKIYRRSIGRWEEVK
jgi:hypothetical protein